MPMVKKLVNCVSILLFLVLVVLSVLYGNIVTGNAQLEIYKMLVTVSAIIFGVMGAWLSLLKVEIVSGIESASCNEEGSYYVNKARGLIRPMTSSAIILLFGLFYVFMYYSVSKIDFVQAHAGFFRRVSFSVLVALSCWQVYSIIAVMASSADFLLNISRRNRDLSGDRSRRSH